MAAAKLDTQIIHISAPKSANSALSLTFLKNAILFQKIYRDYIMRNGYSHQIPYSSHQPTQQAMIYAQAFQGNVSSATSYLSQPQEQRAAYYLQAHHPSALLSAPYSSYQPTQQAMIYAQAFQGNGSSAIPYPQPSLQQQAYLYAQSIQQPANIFDLKFLTNRPIKNSNAERKEKLLNNFSNHLALNGTKELCKNKAPENTTTLSNDEISLAKFALSCIEDQSNTKFSYKNLYVRDQFAEQKNNNTYFCSHLDMLRLKSKTEVLECSSQEPKLY